MSSIILVSVATKWSMIAAMVGEHKMTVGQVFERFRQMPEMRRLVDECYLNENLLEAASRFYASEEFAAVKEYISSKHYGASGLVMDLGGGNGVASLAFYWAGYQVVLVEPDYSDVVGLGAIAPVIRQMQCDIRLCAAVGETLPFIDNKFDVVYVRQVLHHSSNPLALCEEVRRVLKPQGLFIATREHVISKPRDLNVFLQNHPVHPYTGGENALLLREYCKFLNRAGFKRVKVLGPWVSVINYYPWSKSQYADKCRNALNKVAGTKIGRYLATRKVASQFCGWYWSKRDQTPGRLYSFISTR